MARTPQPTTTPTAPTPEAPPLTPAENNTVPAPSPDAAEPAPGAAAEAAAQAAAAAATETPEPAAPAKRETEKPLRDQMMEHISRNRQKDREKHASTTPDVRDMIDPASQTRGPNDPPPAAPEPEPEPEPEPAPAAATTPAEPTTVPGAQPGERMVLVELDGMRVSVPESKVSAALARGIAAERELSARMNQPNQPRQAPPQDGGTVAPQAEQDSDEAEERRAYIHALQYGTPEEAAEAHRKLEERLLAKRADPNDVERRIEAKLEETGKIEALERLSVRYPEVFADQNLALLSGPVLKQVLSERGVVGRVPNVAEYASAMETTFDRILTRYGGKPSRLQTSDAAPAAPAAPSTSAPTTARGQPSVTVTPSAIEVRREVKRAQPTPPVATQPAGFAPTTPARQNRSDTIREMRKARGQVV